jgi:hypothetical protein
MAPEAISSMIAVTEGATFTINSTQLLDKQQVSALATEGLYQMLSGLLLRSTVKDGVLAPHCAFAEVRKPVENARKIRHVTRDL